MPNNRISVAVPTDDIPYKNDYVILYSNATEKPMEKYREIFPKTFLKKTQVA